MYIPIIINQTGLLKRISPWLFFLHLVKLLLIIHFTCWIIFGVNLNSVTVCRSGRSSWRVWVFLSSPQGLKLEMIRVFLSTLTPILPSMNFWCITWRYLCAHTHTHTVLNTQSSTHSPHHALLNALSCILPVHTKYQTILSLSLNLLCLTRYTIDLPFKHYIPTRLP